jgi:hypothetical protein
MMKMDDAIDKAEAHHFLQFNFPASLQRIKCELYGKNRTGQIAEMRFVNISNSASPYELDKGILVNRLSR